MRRVPAPTFRLSAPTDGHVWMWWMLAASLLRAVGALPYGSIAMVVGAACFARWVWTSLREPAAPSWVAPVEGVSDAEVFSVMQWMVMLVMVAAGDLPGAAFALVIASACGLRAWATYLTQRMRLRTLSAA
ncbi:TPA: hypothetical protein QDB45_001737 [Burkholderia vietnamiensis]|nr:hypothetical protein [Burkholderia vietnamiensis]